MDLEKWIDKTFGLRPNKGTNVRHIEFDWNKLDENIYLGTNFCCQYHFNKELLSLGISADISLEEERLDMASGVNSFLWLPTPDHQPPSLESMQLGIDCLKSLVKYGRKVYIHCKNGHGRAPTLVAGYYISTGMSVDQAIDFIKSKRKEIHLEVSQRNMLEEFAKKYK